MNSFHQTYYEAAKQREIHPVTSPADSPALINSTVERKWKAYFCLIIIQT